MIGYEIEYFCFLFIVVLFSAGNVKKNVFTVFIVPIVTIDGFKEDEEDASDGTPLRGCHRDSAVPSGDVSTGIYNSYQIIYNPHPQPQSKILPLS